jgi:hypothetical protein
MQAVLFNVQQNKIPFQTFWKRQKIHRRGVVSCEDKQTEIRKPTVTDIRVQGQTNKFRD